MTKSSLHSLQSKKCTAQVRVKLSSACVETAGGL